MTSTGLNVGMNHASFFKREQMFGDAGLRRADGVDNVTPTRRAVRGQESQDFIAGPVAEGRDGRFHVG